jgi:hypothetical protein
MQPIARTPLAWTTELRNAMKPAGSDAGCSRKQPRAEQRGQRDQ